VGIATGGAGDEPRQADEAATGPEPSTSGAGPVGAPADDAGPTLLEVARIGKAHGLKGQVVVHPTSNRPGRFAAGSVLHGVPVRGVARDLVIETSRPLQQKWVVRFEGTSDREGAEALRGITLYGEPLDDLDDDELWIHELIGAVVWEGERELGPVVAVEANPAHDLLVLESGALIPMVFVTGTEPGRIEVVLPTGLVE
jgi:16S rRNA processing protein RimM